MSPLSDLMRKYQTFFRVDELSHGNRKKTDRIMWSLQGRFENGVISLNKGEWNMKFLDELFQFPNDLVHDDTVDALSYIDQLANVAYGIGDMPQEEYEFIDVVSGY